MLKSRENTFLSFRIGLENFGNGCALACECTSPLLFHSASSGTFFKCRFGILIAAMLSFSFGQISTVWEFLNSPWHLQAAYSLGANDRLKFPTNWLVAPQLTGYSCSNFCIFSVATGIVNKNRFEAIPFKNCMDYCNQCTPSTALEWLLTLVIFVYLLCFMGQVVWKREHMGRNTSATGCSCVRGGRPRYQYCTLLCALPWIPRPCRFDSSHVLSPSQPHGGIASYEILL